MKKIKKQQKKRIQYEINGESKTLNEWCKEYGIARQVVHRRLTHGYYLEEALTEPVPERYTPNGGTGIKITHNGKEYPSIDSLAAAYGLDKTTVHARYKRGIRGDALVAPPYGKGCNVSNEKK